MRTGSPPWRARADDARGAHHRNWRGGACQVRPRRRRRGALVIAPAAVGARRPRRRGRRVRPRRPKPARDFEDFVGGSVLAWLGGFAVLAGLAFLLTMAISRGWLGEGARTLLAGGLSLGLLAVGVWLREHRDRTRGGTRRGRGRHRGLLRHARRRRSCLRARAAAGRAARRVRDRRRRHRARGPLARAGRSAGSACSARCSRPRRSARSTTAASSSSRSPTRPRSPCSSGSAGPRSRRPRSPSRRSSGSGGCCSRTRAAATCSAHARRLRRADRRARARPRGQPARAAPGRDRPGRGRRRHASRRAGDRRGAARRDRLGLLDGDGWLAALAAAHIVVGIGAAHVRRISRELAPARPRRRRRAGRPRVRRRSPAGCRWCSAGRCRRSRSPRCSAPPAPSTGSGPTRLRRILGMPAAAPGHGPDAIARAAPPWSSRILDAVAAACVGGVDWVSRPPGS